MQMLVSPANLLQVTLREVHAADDLSPFRSLNEGWITKYFELEETDRQQLAHPEVLLDQGGHIYFAIVNNQVVGCYALLPMDDAVLQLSKMAVSPDWQGRGIGRQLVQHATGEARKLGADKLFLGSNARLASAVALYTSVGFQHVPPHLAPKLGYNRADVFMELSLR